MRAAWYRTVVGSSFNNTLAFANNTFGYAVYVYAGLLTTGTNGSDAVVQAVGHFDQVQDDPATITLSSTGAGNIDVCGWVGAQNLGDVGPTTAASGWTTDADDYDAGDTVFVVGQSRTGTTTTASISFTFPSQLTHGVALELQTASATGNPWYYYSQQ